MSDNLKFKCKNAEDVLNNVRSSRILYEIYKELELALKNEIQQEKQKNK